MDSMRHCSSQHSLSRRSETGPCESAVTIWTISSEMLDMYMTIQDVGELEKWTTKFASRHDLSTIVDSLWLCDRIYLTTAIFPRLTTGLK